MPFSRFSIPLLATLLLASATTVDAEWRVLWRDEFGYTGPPDPDKWNVAKWPPGRVNDELQAYTQRPRNLRVEDGKLVIETHFDPDAQPRFSSGRISSKGKGFSTYGRFEARIRFPSARGTWSAFWLMPEDPSVYGLNKKEGWYWPNCGEIDIV
ncbi:glycoside hydrolase family 16 protein, partial [Thiorhodococcus minor]